MRGVIAWRYYRGLAYNTSAQHESENVFYFKSETDFRNGSLGCSFLKLKLKIVRNRIKNLFSQKSETMLIKSS